MELPFKYIVLCIIRMLDEREMSLIIKKSNLVDFINELFKKAYFTIEEKKELVDNFDFNYELDDLFNKYFKYFEIDGEDIIFDSDYIEELNELILGEMEEYDIVFLHDIDFAIECNTVFLDILGIKIRKELYNCLVDIEKEIEDCYKKLYKYEISVNSSCGSCEDIIKRLKFLYMKRRVLLFNTENLISYNERCDLANYADNIVEKMVEIDDVTLLLEDDSFDESDIVYDVFLKSIFTGTSSYYSNLRERINIDITEVNNNMKYSKINFYLTFLDLLNREIDASSGMVNVELIKVKYRLMNALDSSYDLALFIDEDFAIKEKYKEEYYFLQDAVYYFIKEILLYDDDKYKNGDFNVRNEMVYVTNILKKLIIESYYILTKERGIVSSIRDNSLYGVNNISSKILDDIINKTKRKVKEK